MNKQYLKSFIFPKKHEKKVNIAPLSHLKKVAIIPAYKPPKRTSSLIKSLVGIDNLTVLLVDDSTPYDSKEYEVIRDIIKYSKVNKKVKVIRTPYNLLKAGTLNWGLKHIRESKINPDIVITFDDDVTIYKSTIPQLVSSLYENKNVAATCSLVRVKNKNKNLITRLQSLEYHSFNITKLCDNGFIMGPLVMPGMLTAFKYSVLKRNEFDRNNLIEDYEVTAKIKKAGWSVLVNPNSLASTNVPEKMSTLWRQRARWTYGGLTVVEKYYNYLPSIIQDVLGHGLFLSLVAIIIISVTFSSAGVVALILLKALYLAILIQFSVSYLFGIYTLKYYKDADWTDRLLKLTIFPELIYSIILSLVLFGSYIFYIFNKSFFLLSKSIMALHNVGLTFFNKLGYSLSWGTRQLVKGVGTNE